MAQPHNYAVAQPQPQGADGIEKGAIALAVVGVLILLVAFAGYTFPKPRLVLGLSLGSMLIGTSVYASRKYLPQLPGIKNNGVWQHGLTSRGLLAWAIGILLTGFYVIIYWYPQFLGLGKDGAANKGLIALFDPLSMVMTGEKSSQWFMYGTLYTLAILALGVKFLLKYRGNPYHQIRTAAVMICQLAFAWLIPNILTSMQSGQAYFNKDVKLIFPLNYEFFYASHLKAMLESGALGMFFLVFGLFMFLIFAPIITYFVGKRWYCSWVCGCGGLAETAGDSFRQLSSKKVSSWRIERYLIHGVLVAVTVMTIVVLYGYFSGSDSIFGLSIYHYFQKPYGFFIGSIFSGIVGVGFYPLMGNRVWCRFGCPMAAYIGLIQRFKSRFRITTNGGQCISCGNCSTYCEQGIDVRWYAQRGQDIVRASCVGCGVCSSVCPRGVLKLENGPTEGRLDEDFSLLGLKKLDVKK